MQVPDDERLDSICLVLTYEPATQPGSLYIAEYTALTRISSFFDYFINQWGTISYPNGFRFQKYFSSFILL